jgi:hypothetical protein
MLWFWIMSLLWRAFDRRGTTSEEPDSERLVLQHINRLHRDDLAVKCHFHVFVWSTFVARERRLRLRSFTGRAGLIATAAGHAVTSRTTDTIKVWSSFSRQKVLATAPERREPRQRCAARVSRQQTGLRMEQRSPFLPDVSLPGSSVLSAWLPEHARSHPNLVRGAG